MPDPWHFLSLFPVFLIFDLFKNHVFWPFFGHFLVNFLDPFFSKNIKESSKNEFKNEQKVTHFLVQKSDIFVS